MDEYNFYSGKVTGQEIDNGVFYALYDGLYVWNAVNLTGTGASPISAGVSTPANPSTADRRNPQISEDDIPLRVWFSNPDAVCSDVEVKTEVTDQARTLSVKATINGTTNITVLMGKAHRLGSW